LRKENAMELRKLCTLDTVCCGRHESVQGAALLMRKHHVGDIVVSVIALGLDPVGLEVGDIMSDDLLVAGEHDDPYATIERMRLRGIRRVPVVTDHGSLAGIVSADDLLVFLAEEMEELSRISPYQQQHEKRARQ
jgi:CBS domain-containing protein